MKLDIIESKAQKLSECYDLRESYLEEWQVNTKPLLIKTLNTLVKEIKIGWFVQTVDQIVNLENVNIQFGAQPSGIVQKQLNSVKHFSKEGAGLIFGQLVNGKVAVIISYPFIESWVTQKPHEVIERVEPSQITEEYIFAQAGRFLDEMIKWESSDLSYNKIGF